MPKEKAPTEQTGAIERTLRALQAVAELDEFTPRNLAEYVSIPTSTAYRLIQSLIAVNFVEKSGQGSYRVGRQLFRLASLIVDHSDYEVVARPFLQDLADRFEETVSFALYLPNEYAFTIVDTILAKHPLQFVVTKFRPRPMVWGALGRSILPFLPEDHIQEAIARQGVGYDGDVPPVTRELLAAECETVHRLGCYVGTSPNAFGSNGTAAAVFNSRGQVLGSIGITVPMVRYDPVLQPALTEAVVNAARGISAALGFGAAQSRR